MLETVRDKIQREKDKDALLSMSLDSINAESENETHNVEEEVKSVASAFEEYKAKYQDSLKVVDPGVSPLGTKVILTAKLVNLVEIQEKIASQKVDINLDFFEHLKQMTAGVQEVVAKGSYAKQVEIGDTVALEMADFYRVKNPGSVNREEVFELPLEKINGKDYLVVQESNIKYIYNK